MTCDGLSSNVEVHIAPSLAFSSLGAQYAVLFFILSQCIMHVEGGQLYRKDSLLSSPRQFYREDSVSIGRTQHSDTYLVRDHNSSGNRQSKHSLLRYVTDSFVNRHLLAA